jgi:predicted outer membrane repeat protein
MRPFPAVHPWRGLGVLGAAVVLAALIFVRDSFAADPCVVTVTEAQGPAALQTALTAGPGAGCTERRIEVSGTFALTSTLEVKVDGSVPVRLVGVGAQRAVITTADGSTVRLIDVVRRGMATSGTVRFERLVLRDGNAGVLGGAVWAKSGITLEARDVQFLQNTAGAGGAISADVVVLEDVEFRDNVADEGGAIDAGQVTGNRVTFASNRATSGEGLGGAIIAMGDVTFVNSTFDDNRAKEGGALFVTSNVATLITLEFVTMSGSRADDGAHIMAEAVTTGTIGLVTRGSVFTGALRLDGQAATSDCSGLDAATSTSAHSVVVGIDVGGTLTTGCRAVTPIAAAPALGALELAGGVTRSRAPALDGPLVDAFDCVAGWASTDQRGTTRPQPTGGRCDIGAVEVVQVVAPPPQGPEDDDDVEVQTDPGPSGDGDVDGGNASGAAGGSPVTVGGPIPTRIDAGGGPRWSVRR